MMKLYKEDYESYKEQQLLQLRASMMAVEANLALLDWLQGKIKNAKSKLRKGKKKGIFNLQKS